MMRNVRWSMLLSHHAPCDYDRTWQIGPLHICVRCLGVAAGTTVALAYWDGWSNLPVLGILAAALPGVADFLLHELQLSASCGARRFLTGACFGVFVAALCSAGIHWQWGRIALYLGWFLFLQVAAGGVLRCSGRLEALLARYEDGAHL